MSRIPLHSNVSYTCVPYPSLSRSDCHLGAVRVRRRLVGADAFRDIDDIDDDDVVTLLVLDLDVNIRAGSVVDDHDLGIVVLAIAGVVVGIHKQILLLSWPTAAAVVLNWRSSAKLSRGLRCA